jgi:predicted phage-related endonuclease
MSAATSKVLGEVHAHSDGTEIDLFGQTEVIRQYLNAVQAKKDAESAVTMYGNILKQYLGDAERGKADGYTVTWKTQTRGAFDINRFAKEHPELNLEDYYKTIIYRNFTVKEN